MTTTVLRRSLAILLETMIQGLVFAISDPNVGSSRTHQISPRRGNVPRLLNPIRLIRQCVPITFDGKDIGRGIRDLAGPDHSLFTFSQFGCDCFRYI
jgi:hypothetical protein